AGVRPRCATRKRLRAGGHERPRLLPTVVVRIHAVLEIGDAFSGNLGTRGGDTLLDTKIYQECGALLVGEAVFGYLRGARGIAIRLAHIGGDEPFLLQTELTPCHVR